MASAVVSILNSIDRLSSDEQQEIILDLGEGPGYLSPNPVYLKGYGYG